MNGSPARDQIIDGIALNQFASVLAGVALGVHLDRALAGEAVDPHTWERAQRAWEAKIAESVERDGGLHAAFDEALAAARARYGRRVVPLADDLATWLDFVRVWSVDADPLALLARLGMSAADLVNLHATWAQRLSADPVLRDEAQEVLKRDPNPVPQLTFIPPVVSESPLPPPREAAWKEVTGGPSELDELWDLPLPGRVVTALAPPTHETTGTRESPPTSDDLSTTGPMPRVLLPAVPFQPAAAPALPGRHDEPLQSSDSGPRTRSPGPALDLTTMGPVAPMLAPLLPFQRTEAPTRSGETPATSAQPQRPSAPRPAAPLSVTGPIPEAIRAALPFQRLDAPRGAAPERVGEAGAEPAPVSISSVQGPDSTGPITKPVAPVLAAALPFRRDGDAAPLAPPTTAIAASPSAPQGLTLAQFASLCAELAAFPHGAEQVFRRYGLASRRARLRTNLMWKERLQRNPSEYLEWQRLYQIYQAHLKGGTRRDR